MALFSKDPEFHPTGASRYSLHTDVPDDDEDNGDLDMNLFTQTGQNPQGCATFQRTVGSLPVESSLEGLAIDVNQPPPNIVPPIGIQTVGGPNITPGLGRVNVQQQNLVPQVGIESAVASSIGSGLPLGTLPVQSIAQHIGMHSGTSAISTGSSVRSNVPAQNIAQRIAMQSARSSLATAGIGRGTAAAQYTPQQIGMQTGTPTSTTAGMGRGTPQEQYIPQQMGVYGRTQASATAGMGRGTPQVPYTPQQVGMQTGSPASASGIVMGTAPIGNQGTTPMDIQQQTGMMTNPRAITGGLSVNQPMDPSLASGTSTPLSEATIESGFVQKRLHQWESRSTPKHRGRNSHKQTKKNIVQSAPESQSPGRSQSPKSPGKSQKVLQRAKVLEGARVQKIHQPPL